MLSLQSNRQRIEKFVYAKGTNVALYNAERADKYQKFERSIFRALNRQIADIAKDPNRIDTMILLAKQDDIDLRKLDVKNIAPQLLAEVSHAFQDSLGKLVNVAAYLYWAGEQGGQAALDKLGIGGVFGLKNPELLAYFDDYSNLLITSVDDYTKRWIAAKIQEGKTLGLSPYEIAETLRSDGKIISKIRAERIVLTETAKAMTHVEVEAARRYGIEEKIWRTSLDDRVDPICLGLEGERVGINRLFSIGTEGPPAHVSCRCFIEEVVPTFWQIPDNLWLGQ